MALFKILRGNSSKLFNSSGGISSTVPFNDGYCYFTPDNKKFYIDWLDESKGQHRDPLNSFLADKLLSSWTDVNKVQHTGSAKLVGFTDGAATINDSNEEIPTSAVLYAKFSDVEDTLAALDNDKMDKVNPTGTGYFSLNRKAGHTPGTNSVAVGDQTTASGNYSFAEGNTTIASGEGAHTEGYNTTASGSYSHAEGYSSEAIQSYAHAEGAYTTASGYRSHAEGHDTTASGNNSHAEGSHTEASGKYSHTEGSDTIASGESSHAEGKGSKATHKSQHVEGEYNILDTSTATADARGTYVHIVGNGTADNARSNALTLTWSGDLWHSGKLAHGNKVSAEGSYSYSGGSETSALGNYSHAEGVKTVAQGASSHTEGESTTAFGTASHAEGLSSIAQGNYSHAQNQGTLDNGNAQTAIGKFNVADTTSAFIIGNGADADHRSNMFFIDWNGNACFLNTLLVGTNATTPSKIADAKFYVEGKSYFNGGVTVTGNLTASTAPSNDDHLVNKKYVDDNLMRLTHRYIKAKDGQANFDFGLVGVDDITNYYLIYFNGLLLIEGIHYSISNKSVVNLLGWSATADDYLQLVGFKPKNPTTLNKGGV